jgi:hypothetical protein
LLSVESVGVIGGNTSIVGLVFKDKVPISLSIVINKNINNSLFILEAHLQIASYSSTKILIVNASSRDVFTNDGRYLGKTMFWISPASKGDLVEYVGRGNSSVLAEVISSTPEDTIQGPQDVVALQTLPIYQTSGKYIGIDRKSKIDPSDTQTAEHFHPRINYYDADTFVMIKGEVSEDAVLSAFNILDIVAPNGVSLTYTNIDLGPPNLLVVLTESTPYVILVLIIVVTIVYFFFMKRKA